jgi:hypothetical protein
MNKLSTPQSFDELTESLKRLNQGRLPSRRMTSAPTEHSILLAQSDGRCHHCGGDTTRQSLRLSIWSLTLLSGGTH